MDKTNLKNLESLVKVEIWVKFNKEKIDEIELFSKDFQRFTNEIKLPISKFEFRNNKN